MDKRGFKWKSLINQGIGKRYQIMQISKPADLVVSNLVAISRKMKMNQETISVKTALVMNFSKDQIKIAADKKKSIELPYNYMACLHELKKKQNIDWIAEFDVKNKMFQDVDELGENIYQRGVRAIMSDNVKVSYTDVISQNIDLQEKEAEQYLTSVISSVYRLPPFDFTPVDGYSFLSVRAA